MDDRLIVIDGCTFFMSSRNGDVREGEPAGYFFLDVRHLSRWELLVDGKPLEALAGDPVDYYSARIVSATSSGDDPTLSVRRDRFVTDGVTEDVVVTNHSHRPRRLTLELRFDADFADVMEAHKPGTHAEGRRRWRHDGVSATISVELEDWSRATEVRFSKPCRLTRGRAVWRLALDAREEWHVRVAVTAHADGRAWTPQLGSGAFGREPKMPLTLAQWLRRAPAVTGGTDAMRHVYHRSLVDLASLRLRPTDTIRQPVVAGGVPWFMTLFGRDSLVAAYEALPFAPALAAATLEVLADRQATETDHDRDAEPGKILHELRRGKLAALGRIPHTPYYGTHDATLWWLIVLDEYERWTGDRALVRRLEPNARAAVGWMQGPGDLDGDGYLEYRKRSTLAGALVNQGWKDSDDAIVFADGRTAKPPIATCEIQGYAYDARLRVARLARTVWRDAGWADQLEGEAADLKERFNRDFWLGRRRHFALALDGRKRRVDALASNVGHLLWSGIVDESLVARTAARLARDELFTGWGIRTLSARHPGYSPLEYHNGAVWPHDTALCAEGLRRAGRRRDATRLAAALFDAASRFEHRLPELFGGFERDETDRPVPYPDALVPQAWAAAAPLLALRTILGLEPDSVDPVLPKGWDQVRVRGLRVRGERAQFG